MLRPNLLNWQFGLYPENHTTRLNLAIHLVTVPVFHMGFVTLLMGLFTLSGFTILSGWVFAATAVVAQGFGHKKESVAPVPFDGPLDGFSRLLLEQLVTFPRFVLTGGFLRAWAKSAPSQ